MSDKKTYLCEFCDSQQGLDDRVVTVYRHRGGQHFIFEHVPAQVCRGCGHRYYAWEVAEQMEQLMDAPETQARTRPVPVIEMGKPSPV